MCSIHLHVYKYNVHGKSMSARANWLLCNGIITILLGPGLICGFPTYIEEDDIVRVS